MRLYFLTAMICFSMSSLAQFAIISDKDGYVNMRSSAALSNNIQDTLHNGRIVFCYEREGSFYSAEYAKRGENKTGYVYHDRVKMVTGFEKVPAVKSPANTETFSNSSVKVIISLQRFDKSKYRITYHKDAPGVVEKINGKYVWGTDGNLPAMEYKSIQVQVEQKTITLPASATENLFEPGTGTTKVNYDRAKDIVYIQAANSDGAGYYEVIWRIVNGVYKDKWVVAGF